ncbi:MAG: GatB/YqeY domain-containing protein [bacterium]|nr:GatB/YqeY domain-containing protein [bacterium]
MALKETLSGEMKTAMKAGDPDRVGLFRMIISAINNKEIERKGQGKEGPMSDEEITQLLMSESKKRRESAEVYTQGNRADLADKEKKEVEIISHFLPKQMSPEETEKAVLEILNKSGAKEIGLAMKEVMKELRGKADGALIGEIVKKKLSS